MLAIVHTEVKPYLTTHGAAMLTNESSVPGHVESFLYYNVYLFFIHPFVNVANLFYYLH